MSTGVVDRAPERGTSGRGLDARWYGAALTHG